MNVKKLSAAIFSTLIAVSLLSSCNYFKASPASSPENTATEKPQADAADEIVNAMSLSDRIWQMFITTPEDITGIGAAVAAGEATKEALEKYPVGGFIYFSKNIESLEQIKEMLANTQSYSKIPMFTAVDEEGGRVQRLGNAGLVTKLPSMREIGDTGDESKAAYVGETLGRELRTIGFNVDFAPVADVITVGANEDIGDRSFGSDPQLVAKMITAEVGAMEGQNLCSVLKHFPGNGSTSANTHTEEGISYRTLDEMRTTEFIPFQAGIDAGADMVMIAHVSVPSVTGDNTPSTLSKPVIDLLRNELGFSGIAVSDAFNMAAITSKYTPDTAAVEAVKAGIDIILMSPDVVSAHRAILSAVENGEISEERINESVKRIIQLKLDKNIIEQ